MDDAPEISRSEPQMPDGPLKQLGDYEIEVILRGMLMKFMMR